MGITHGGVLCCVLIIQRVHNNKKKQQKNKKEASKLIDDKETFQLFDRGTYNEAGYLSNSIKTTNNDRWKKC